MTGEVQDVDGVQVVHWNPKDSPIPGTIGQVFSRAPRKNNFGDLLGPMVVELMRAGRPTVDASRPRPRLLTVGSILHLAHNFDTVWGSGVNGKLPPEFYRFDSLDVRAVRGPRTREFLRQRGIEAPAVFGDPALLLPALHPQLSTWAESRQFALAVVPNLNDADSYRGHPDFVDPRGTLDAVLKRIARSERVVGSSLHGIVVAESLGIPAALIGTDAESSFKYDDYYEGTGRAKPGNFATLDDALRSRPVVAELDWNPAGLLAAFPHDLWERASISSAR